jgi:hypothetical protein
VGDGSICLSAIPFYGISVWSKPIAAGAAAVLFVNLLKLEQQVSIPITDIPDIVAVCGTGPGPNNEMNPLGCSVKDVWAGKEQPSPAEGRFDLKLRPHQSVFYIVRRPS